MNDNKAFAIFIVAASACGAITIGTMTYVGGQTKQKELDLKIEQEKTKQLEIQYGKDTTTVKHQVD
jgi:hypothetical protein